MARRIEAVDVVVVPRANDRVVGLECRRPSESDAGLKGTRREFLGFRTWSR